MRTTKQRKLQNGGSTKTKISKKKSTRKSNWFSNNVSNENIEHINEYLRMNKTQRAESNGSWKLVPKDSCEVYRDRRKKQLERQTQRSDGTMSEDSLEYNRDKTRPKESDKRVKKRPVRYARRTRRRPQSESSNQSRTSCCSMCTTCASTSDME